MSKLLQILIPISLLLCFPLQGQEDYIYTITDYTPENGLAGRFINYTHKGSRGLFWIGTQNGLHRFDGREFKIFDEAYGLPFNQVMEIYEDSEGWLWLYRSCMGKDKDYCFKDLAFFHRETYEIQTFEERFGAETPFKPTDVELITTSPSYDKLVITTQQHTYLWTVDAQFQVLPFLNDQTNRLLVGILDDGKMGVIQKQGDQFQYCLLSSEGQKLKSEVLAATEGYKFNRRLTRKKEIANYNHNQYLNGSVVIGVDNWYRLNNIGELIPHEVSELFPGQHDRQGNRHYYFDEKTQSFWTAGRDGLRVINLEKKRFFGIHNGNTNRIFQGLSAVSEEEIFYLYGVYNYINHSNHPNFPNIKLENIERVIPPLFPRISKSDLKTAQAFFPFRSLFFIQQPSGELAIQRTDEFFNHKFWSVHACLKTDQEFWLGTDKGFWAYDTENESLSIFENYNEFTNFKDSYIHAIQALTEDEYLISTNKGLFCWHTQQGILAQYGQNAKGKYFIPSDNIYHLHHAKDGTLWLATRDGLIHLSLDENKLFENGQHFEFFTKEEGLLSNICVAVYEDEFGFLWIATEKGLVQFELATSNLKVYTTKDGLALNYFREYNHYHAPTGELIFGGIDGIISFHPKDFKDEVLSPPEVPLIITEYELYNPSEQRFEIATSQLINGGEIVLQPDIRLFNLKVCLEDYRNAKGQMFAFKIQGYQDEWQEDNSNLIRISGLPYGNHQLEIKGRLADGRYSSNHFTIPIRVLKPFYLQSWFLLLILGLITFSIWLGVRLGTKYQRRRQQELEQKVAEQTQELRSLDEMKSRFFANISHELRTPLTLMLAPISKALKENKLTNQTYTNLLIAKRNGDRLHKMVDEILDLTKLEASNIELEPSTVEWYSFLNLLVNQFESLANSRKIKLTSNYELKEGLRVEIDKEKTETILYNLLSNALKFTKEGGEVKLEASQDDMSLKIKISDTGIGIHPEDLPNIFNRFYQSQKQNYTAQGGTGIGLSLTNELVRLMGGTISVKSQLGKGSTFLVKIPKIEVISTKSAKLNSIHKSNDEINSPKITFEPIPIDNQKANILLVEDNPDLRIFLQSLLQEKYNIILAENGQVALDLLGSKEFKYNLIVSDVMMPIMDGFRLLEKLKSSPQHRHIPVIMLTARIEIKDKLKALRIGVDDYLTKPFIEEELMARVENLLNNASKRHLSLSKNGNKKQSSNGNKLPQKETTPVLKIDPEWLENLEKTILKRLDDVNLVIDDIALDMNLSRRQFYRRIKENTGLTANQYLKTIRLTQARNFLENKKYDSVKAIAYAVGFKDVVYFSRQFKKEFGKLPSEYDLGSVHNS